MERISKDLILTVRLRIGRRIPCNDVYELLVRRRDVNCYLEYSLSYLSSTTGVGYKLSDAPQKILVTGGM